MVRTARGARGGMEIYRYRQLLLLRWFLLGFALLPLLSEGWLWGGWGLGALLSAFLVALFLGLLALVSRLDLRRTAARLSLEGGVLIFEPGSYLRRQRPVPMRPAGIGNTRRESLSNPKGSPLEVLLFDYQGETWRVFLSEARFIDRPQLDRLFPLSEARGGGADG